MQIKISVVIPTYKRPELLVRCLEALVAQTLDHSIFEVIVISDGPDLPTEKAINEWIIKRKLNLNYLKSAAQKGPAGARNLGWQYAKGILIAFTDDDCIPDKRWLETIMDNYNGEDYIAFTGQTIVPLAESPSDFAVNTAQLQDAEFITANCACTYKALLWIKGFDERFELAWREDSDLHFKLLLHEIPIIDLSDALMVHPVRNAPWGISIKEQKKSAYDALLFKKYPQFYRSKVQQYPLWNYYITILLWLMLVFFAILSLRIWMLFTGLFLIASISFFLYKRLKHTSKSARHVTEMLVTSLLIPFLSVYWRIYGGVKFRVFFI